MTHPNPKDPQAELRKAILEEIAFTHGSKPAEVHPDSLISQVADEILALFQARQQELLSDNYERGYSDGFTARNKELWKPSKTNDGGSHDRKG